MNHGFNVDIATQYGIAEAILLEHLSFWIAKNKADKTNFFDGYYWTYSSTKALAELFPYMSPKSISRALHHLKEEGLVLFGNYNKSAYDRTMWYALTEDGELVLQNGKMDLSKGKMEEPKTENQNAQNVQPIPDISTDISTDIVSNDTCTEPEKPTSAPPVITLPLNDKTEHEITQDDVDHWKELYPAVDVMTELRKMKGWCEGNPAKRKTRRGIVRFVNAWLAKEQDRGGSRKTSQSPVSRFLEGAET